MKPILLSLLLASFGACAADDDPAGYAPGLGTHESPVPGEDAYAVTTRIDLALAPPEIDAAVANLRAFSQHPAHAILERARAAESPDVQQLDTALSTTLHDKLEGWLDTEIDKARISSKTLRQYTTDIADISASVLREFTIESSLTITPTGATHSFKDLNFTPVDLDIIVPIGGLNADSLLQRTTATVGEAGALALGDQHFGLAFGSHAWHGLNLASTTLYGADLSALTTTLDCRAIAQIVAAKCVSGSCVGHASQIQAACTSGLAGLVADLRDHITPIELDVFRLTHGSARLVDDDTDGLADRIVDGTWGVEADAGLGPRTATAPFLAW